MHFNEKEAGLNWQHRAHKSKKNTICAGHHYVQTNHVSKMYVHSEYIIIYLDFRPWILINPATVHWSAYIPNLSLKCLYTKPFIEVPIYQTFVTGIDSASVFTILLFYFVPIVRYFCFSFYIHFMSIYSQNRCTFTVFNTYTGCSGEKNAVINTVCSIFDSPSIALKIPLHFQ